MKWTALFLMLVLPVFAGIVEAAHHHSDNALHPDCAVCLSIAGHTLNAPGPECGPAVIHETVSLLDSPQTNLLFVSGTTPRLTGRSPPA